MMDIARREVRDQFGAEPPVFEVGEPSTEMMSLVGLTDDQRQTIGSFVTWIRQQAKQAEQPSASSDV